MACAMERYLTFGSFPRIELTLILSHHHSQSTMKDANIILPLSLLIAGGKLVKASPAPLPSINFIK
jgi:hypothetical protein